MVVSSVLDTGDCTFGPFPIRRAALPPHPSAKNAEEWGTQSQPHRSTIDLDLCLEWVGTRGHDDPGGSRPRLDIQRL